jgi:hypothetical protein
MGASLVVAALLIRAVDAGPAGADDYTTPTAFADDFKSFGKKPPVLRSSPNGRREPDYPTGSTQSGTAIVKCVLTVEARARDCIVVKGVSPSIDRAVVDWLSGARWSPVTTLDGKPLESGYVFSFRLSPPAAGLPDAGQAR